MNPARHNSAFLQAGVSMVEVLVAIVVSAIGLFSLMTMQMNAVSNNHSAYLRGQASLMANTMIDHLRANETLALAGGYDIGLTATPPEGSDMPTQDLTQWRDHLTNILPSGTGSIDCSSATKICNLVVQWDDSRGTSGSNVQQFSIVTRL